MDGNHCIRAREENWAIRCQNAGYLCCLSSRNQVSLFFLLYMYHLLYIIILIMFKAVLF